MVSHPVEQAPGQRLGGDPLVVGKVHQLPLEAVAGRQPLVLVEHLEGVARQPLAGIEVLTQLAHQALNESGQPEGVLDAGLGIHHPDLDRPEVGVRSHVVPEVGVVLDHARLHHELDPALVVLPVLVGGRNPHPGKRPEDRGPGGGHAGLVRAPERGVRRQPQQHRHVDPHPIGDVDRLVGIVDPHVHVNSEDQLLTGHEAKRRDQVAVARASHDPLVLPLRKGVRPGGCDRHALAGGPPRDLAAKRPQLLSGFGGIRAWVCGDLEHRLHQLRLDLATGRWLEECLDRVDQLERIGVEDHQLLLDPDRVGGAGELVVHG